jgi:adenylate kinase
MVIGVSGVGKTRLVAELNRRVAFLELTRPG